MPIIKWYDLPPQKIAEAAFNINPESTENYPIDYIKLRLAEGIAAGSPNAERCEEALKHLQTIATRKKRAS